MPKLTNHFESLSERFKRVAAHLRLAAERFSTEEHEANAHCACLAPSLRPAAVAAEWEHCSVALSEQDCERFSSAPTP